MYPLEISRAVADALVCFWQVLSQVVPYADSLTEQAQSLCNQCAIRMLYVCDQYAISVQEVCDQYAISMQSVCNQCALQCALKWHARARGREPGDRDPQTPSAEVAPADRAVLRVPSAEGA